jgi:hypothetical protein
MPAMANGWLVRVERLTHTRIPRAGEARRGGIHDGQKPQAVAAHERGRRRRWHRRSRQAERCRRATPRATGASCRTRQGGSRRRRVAPRSWRREPLPAAVVS